MGITTTCLQTIVNSAETISINRRRQVGVQYSKSQIANVTEIISRLPWQLGVKVSTYFDYAQPATRELIEQLDYLDRRYTEVISFANNANLSWMFAYRGDLTLQQLSQLKVSSFTGTSLTLTNLQGFTAGKYLVRQGDFLQINNFPFPFTSISDVQITGSDLANNSITITTHRPNFIDVNNGIINETLNWGNRVQFQVFCNNTPTYTFVPAGSTAAIMFSGDFQLYEYTGNLVTNINEVLVGAGGGIE